MPGDYDWWLAFQAQRLNTIYGREHRILYLTKMPSLAGSRFLEKAPELPVVCSASLNIEDVALRYERGADPPGARMKWLKEMDEAGVEVRARIDPIIDPGSNISCYLDLVDTLAQEVEGLRVVTLGVLRCSTERLYRALPPELRVGLVRSGWGYTYKEEEREFAYGVLVERLREYGIRAGLCKEPARMWRAVRAKGPCNCIMGPKVSGTRA